MRALFLLALLLVPAVAGAPRLEAVVPDLPGPGPGDEGLAVWDPEGPTDLAGWSLRDGEGTWTFPPGVHTHEEPLWTVGDVTTWAAHDGPPPAKAWPPDSGLRLANDGERVCLHDPDGTAVDCFSWGPDGDVTYRSPGAVYRRAPDGLDGWVTPRIHRLGESSLAPARFTADTVTAYASPDNSFTTLQALIDGARERLHLHVYDLHHTALVDALVAAKEAHPDMDLQVLTDGRVVGHGQDERDAVAWSLHRIRSVGGTVVQADGGRYAHHHLKVLVADDTVAMQSENWVPSGVPVDPSWGNRGWGVVVEAPDLADWMATWMQADRTAWDVTSIDPVPPPERRPLRMAPRTGSHEPVDAVTFVGPAAIVPIVAPDHTADPDGDPLLARLRDATERIWTQQLRMEVREDNRLEWDRPDRYLEALAEATARGVDVRVHLQGGFGSRDDNAEAAAWLRARDVSVLRPDPPGIATVHNKGWIIDDAVVVGSMNGHHASRSANREAGLLVDHPGVAAYFAQRFLADEATATEAQPLPLSPLPILLATVGVARTLRRRT